MKHFFVLIIFLVSTSAFAGDYYQSRIDTYDPVSGLYYKAVEATPGGGFLTSKTSSNVVANIAIFDPAKETTALLFREPQKDGISMFLFETGIKDGGIEFNGADYSGVVLNNTRIAKREPRDKLLIGVRNKDLKEIILFVSDKRGVHLKKLVAIPSSADWHIDVKNSKLRVVHQTGKGIRIESYVW